MKIALIVPHIFMWDKILGNNIFAPGSLALDLAEGLADKHHDVTLFTAGPIETKVTNKHTIPQGICGGLKQPDTELSDLIRKDQKKYHNLLKIVELEILSKAFLEAKNFDLLHVYNVNGYEGPIFAKQLKTPIIFTLHDPSKLDLPSPKSYKLVKNLKFTTVSKNQALQAKGLNIIKTIYNGIDFTKFKFYASPSDYFLSYGRIVRPKGIHHAINVCLKTESMLKIAGLHYEGHGGDNYWSTKIAPFIDNKLIKYEGFITKQQEKNKLLGQSKALLFPIQWQEPFGLVMIEANACGTPVIAFNKGSVPEVIKNGVNGFIVKNKQEMIQAMKRVSKIDRKKCREYAEEHFSLERMVDSYLQVYKQLIHSNAETDIAFR